MYGNKPIKSFRDLDVYQRSYKAMILVMTEIIPKLPYSERFDLKDQTSRSSKAVPRLIAEGFAKRHQRAGFQKYLVDAMGECNETIVSLETSKDIYGKYVRVELVERLVNEYDIVGKQLFRLSNGWQTFKRRDQLPHPISKPTSSPNT